MLTLELTMEPLLALPSCGSLAWCVIVWGALEDQFFSTVFFGSGLLFLAMVFASAAIAGGILSSFAIAGDALTNSGVITFGRAVMYTIANVYAIRMAAVFMIALPPSGCVLA
jgi:hypothetical protein